MDVQVPRAATVVWPSREKFSYENALLPKMLNMKPLWRALMVETSVCVEDLPLPDQAEYMTRWRIRGRQLDATTLGTQLNERLDIWLVYIGCTGVSAILFRGQVPFGKHQELWLVVGSNSKVWDSQPSSAQMLWAVHANSVGPRILDRIKWNNYPPSPPWWRREGAKTRHFGVIEMGGGVVQMFHLFCPRLQSWTE